MFNKLLYTKSSQKFLKKIFDRELFLKETETIEKYVNLSGIKYPEDRYLHNNKRALSYFGEYTYETCAFENSDYPRYSRNLDSYVLKFREMFANEWNLNSEKLTYSFITCKNSLEYRIVYMMMISVYKNGSNWKSKFIQEYTEYAYYIEEAFWALTRARESIDKYGVTEENEKIFFNSLNINCQLYKDTLQLINRNIQIRNSKLNSKKESSKEVYKYKINKYIKIFIYNKHADETYLEYSLPVTLFKEKDILMTSEKEVFYHNKFAIDNIAMSKYCFKKEAEKPHKHIDEKFNTRDRFILRVDEEEDFNKMTMPFLILQPHKEQDVYGSEEFTINYNKNPIFFIVITGNSLHRYLSQGLRPFYNEIEEADILLIDICKMTEIFKQLEGYNNEYIAEYFTKLKDEKSNYFLERDNYFNINSIESVIFRGKIQYLKDI